MPEKALLRTVANDKELLSRVVQLFRSTFSPIRTTKRNQTIRLSARAAGTLVEAHNEWDGAAGSALLTEMRMRLGLRFFRRKEQLKKLIVVGLYLARIPLRAIGSASRVSLSTLTAMGSSAQLCACLSSIGSDPPEELPLRLTFARAALPAELLRVISSYCGGLWWARRALIVQLPPPSGSLQAFSADVPRQLLRASRSLVCFERTVFSFSSGASVFAEWGPHNTLWMRGSTAHNTLWMRGSTAAAFVTLLRRERSLLTPGPATVLCLRGVGDVLV